MTKTGRSKSFDSFDLFKFILSFVVMVIHFNPLGDKYFHVLHPWVRIAIPVYFMISGYLFFTKYDALPKDEKNSYLLKFCKRDLILYLFWFIVFLAFTIQYRDYLHAGITYFFGSILVGSTFPASWYLMALVIDILIVAKLDRGAGKYIVPAAALLLYLLCLGQFTYRPLADKISFLPKLYNATAIRWANTFCPGLLWIWLSRVFVHNRERVTTIGMKKVLIAFACSLVLLFAEHTILYNLGWFTMHNDVYLFCVLAGPLFFLTILKMNVKVPNAKFMRNMSTLIYCIHASVGEMIKYYLITPRTGGYEMPWSILCFFATLSVSLLGGWLILKFSDRVKLLKYAY